jgi:hypothetical protein
MGDTGLDIEKRQCGSRLEQLRDRAVPLDRAAAMAKAFIQNWTGLGELPAAVDGDQQHAIVRHFVEVVEPRPSDMPASRGTYLMRLFSEAATLKTTTAARC